MRILTTVLLMMLSVSVYGLENDSRFFSVDELKPGMRGVGRTIFSGDKAEEFEVEILGVLRGTPSPNRSLIIVRLHGSLAERTGVFAGMSGSPVFIDGRLVGAIAYAFPFSKEPIGAITPIADILEVFQTGSEQIESQGGSISFSELAAATVSGKLPQSNLQPVNGIRPVIIGAQGYSNPALAPLVGQSLLPISAPLAFSGIEPATIEYFSSYFQAFGLMPVAAVSGATSTGAITSYNDSTLLPGKSVALELVRGDYGLSILGTVTWRDGDQIYAFGHPTFPPGGMGTSSIPMSESDVVTVVPSIFNSFKMGSAKRLVGSILQDRSTGIYGKLGEIPKMIPFKISVTTSRGKRKSYQMEIINDRQLTPILTQIVTLNSIIATERSFGDLTLSLQGRIKIKGQTDINFSNRFSASNAFIAAVLYSSYPMAVLYGSGFSFDAEGIELELKADDRKNVGYLSSISVDRTEVRRGETITIQASAQNERGETFYERVPIKIPHDTPIGRLNIAVGDGQMMASLDRRAIIDSNPKELSALIAAMNRLPRNDRIYVKLYYSDSGAVIKNLAMPSLPASMLAALDSTRSTGGYLPLPIATVVERELAPSKFLISGQQTIQINIIP